MADMETYCNMDTRNDLKLKQRVFMQTIWFYWMWSSAAAEDANSYGECLVQFIFYRWLDIGGGTND